MLSAVRRNAVCMEAECATDAAASSVLAEFHQELLRRYDLLFVDPSYGSGDPSIERTKSHLIRYAAGNLQGDALSVISGSRTMTAVKCESAELSGVRCIFDEKAKPLKEQILAYMTAEPLGEAAAGITQKVDAWKGIGPDASEWHRKKEENERTLQEELSRRREEEPEEPEIEDPAKEVESFRLRPALLQIIGSTSGISKERMEDSCPSRREIHQGSGGETSNSHHYRPADTVLLDEYLLEKCGDYTKNKEGSRLQYQLEYILFGKESDTDNLEAMLGTLLLAREAANCSFAFSDASMRATAGTIGGILAALTFSPELAEAFTTAVLFAWAYAETIQDVKTLVSGGCVPFLKDRESWRTPVRSILAPYHSTHAQNYGRGWDYRTYLRVLLFLENENTKCGRFLDIIESDIRKTDGNAEFKVDYCFDTFTVNAKFSSGFGYSCEVQRTVTYN